jgi:5-(aminomethyl)-3-furanmethanol phosphate kinase
MQPLITKVGGSLFDWPDLGPRLREWLDANAPPEIILVPGGGRLADIIGDLDRMHGLGDEVAHGMALHAMTINAQLLAALLPGSCVIDGPDLAEMLWEQNRLSILDAMAFCESDDADALPHTWAVTSDSVAARLAVVAGAAELVLLKSAPPPPGDVTAWAECGYVDAWLPRVLARSDVQVRAVNIRQYGTRWDR